MGRPDVPFKYSPVPGSSRVSFPAAFAVAPQIEHKCRQVDNWLVHDVAREAGRGREDTREAVKYTGFPDPSLEPSLLILNDVLRGNDALQIVSVFRWIDGGEVRNVDIRVVVRWVVG